MVLAVKKEERPAEDGRRARANSAASRIEERAIKEDESRGVDNDGNPRESSASAVLCSLALNENVGDQPTAGILKTK